MKQIAAFKETVALARSAPWHTIKAGCSVIHLEDMLSRIIDDQSRAPQYREYSAAKIGRHLGWAQAIVCVYSPLEYTLEVFKAVNQKHKGKDE